MNCARPTAVAVAMLLASGAGTARADTAISSAGVMESGRLCFEVTGVPGDMAVVNLTPVNAHAPGNGQLVSSDTTTPPIASNVNYAPGTVDPNVAAAPIGTDGKVCYLNSNHTTTDLIADHLFTIDSDTIVTTPTGNPDRRVDTRIGLGGTTVPPDGRLCFEVTGVPGDMAVVNLTPVNAHAPGNGQLVSSDTTTPPIASNVNYAPGTVDPNVAAAPIGTDGKVCYLNSNHTTTDLIADHLFTIDSDTIVTTPTGNPDRRVDTRIGLGGTTVPPDGRLCFEVTGVPGDMAVVNLTPVNAHAPGNGQLVSSDTTTPPIASNVNYAPGTVDPNVAAAPIGTDGKVCYLNSNHTTTDLIADHLFTISQAITPHLTWRVIHEYRHGRVDTRVTAPVTAEHCNLAGACIVAVSAPTTGHTYTFLLSTDRGVTWRHSEATFADVAPTVFGGFAAVTITCSANRACTAQSPSVFFSAAAGTGTAYWHTLDGGRTWRREFVTVGGMPA